MMTSTVLLKRYKQDKFKTPRKIMNGDRSGPHEPSKYAGAHLPLEKLI